MQDDTPLFVEGGDTRDFFKAGNGNDFIAGGDGADTLIGGAGDDTIIGDEYTPGQNFKVEPEALVPGSAENTNSAEILIGGAGNDLIIGGGWDDSIVDDGNFTQDEITNPDFVIEIFPSPIRNVLWGGAGDDSLYAGAGDDTLGAGAGNDLVVGGTANDVIFGGAGNDTINAGAGNDSIWSGSGDDILSSGDGSDTFYFADEHGADRIEDFDVEADTLILTNTLYGVSARTDGEGAFTLGIEETVIDGVSGLLLTTGTEDSVFLVGLGEEDFSNITIVT